MNKIKETKILKNNQVAQPDKRTEQTKLIIAGKEFEIIKYSCGKNEVKIFFPKKYKNSSNGNNYWKNVLVADFCHYW